MRERTQENGLTFIPESEVNNMKMYDRVKLIKEKAEYKQEGIKAFDIGIY